MNINYQIFKKINIKIKILNKIKYYLLLINRISEINPINAVNDSIATEEISKIAKKYSI